MSSASSTYNESPTPMKPLSRSTHSDRSYRYNEESVKVIVVFDEGKSQIAIVENSKGEQFDVPMSELRSL